MSVRDDDVQAAVDVLFAYLRDVLYDPKAAHLEPEQLPEPFRDLAHGMMYLAQSIEESRSLANDLANGILDSPKASAGSEIASGLKNLQAALKHITWQVGQVAKGDYQQKLSFAGEFSLSINDMITQLRERDEALRAEIQLNQQFAADARDTALLLEDITKNTAQWIVVVDRSSYDWIYSNHEVLDFLPNKKSAEQLKSILDLKVNEYNQRIANSAKDTATDDTEAQAEAGAPLEGVFELGRNRSDDESAASPAQRFSFTGYPVSWMERKSVALVLLDVTDEQREREKLEQVAYHDPLTKTYSRHYGMLTLDRWQEEGRMFVVAFVDIDGLKYVNDTFGHAEGDEYILATSRLLADFNDRVVISRLGGDEFMLLCCGASLKRTRARLEELRAQFSQSFNGGYERTFSFGLAEASDDNTLTSSRLLSIADENMYEDKRSRKKERLAQQ